MSACRSSSPTSELSAVVATPTVAPAKSSFASAAITPAVVGASEILVADSPIALSARTGFGPRVTVRTRPRASAVPMKALAAARRADAYMNRQYLDPVFLGSYLRTRQALQGVYVGLILVPLIHVLATRQLAEAEAPPVVTTPVRVRAPRTA